MKILLTIAAVIFTVCSYGQPCVSTTPCLTPDNFNVSNVATTTATVSWNAVPCALNYRLMYRKSTSATWTFINVDATSFNLTDLAPNTKYATRVRTHCGNGVYSSISTQKTFTTLQASVGPEEVIYVDMITFKRVNTLEVNNYYIKMTGSKRELILIVQ